MAKKFAVLALFLFCCLLFVTSVWAEQKAAVDLSDLTAEQQALIVNQVKNFKGKGTAEKVNEYVVLANNISAVITKVAGDVGIAADKFLESTSGKITVGLIFWKVAGNDLIDKIMGLVIGSVMFVVFLTLWIYFFRRMCLIKEIKKEYPKEGSFKAIKTIAYHSNGDTDVENVRWVMLAVLVAGVLGNTWLIFG